MSLFLQALLVAIAVTIAFIDAHTTQTHIFRPIFIGPVVGAIMGDFQTGDVYKRQVLWRCRIASIVIRKKQAFLSQY